MAFKRAFILGGAVLLVAGCSTSVTAPNRAMDGGGASATKAQPTAPAAAPAPRMAPMAATAADSTGCRGSWPLTSGFADDTTCTEQQ